MQINLTIYISDTDIAQAQIDNPQMSKEDILGEINNCIYLGGDCVNAILNRKLDINGIDYYIKEDKTVVLDKSWGEMWYDNFPTQTECPFDVIEHHAEGYDFPVSDNIIRFARAMWNEGNLMERKENTK